MNKNEFNINYNCKATSSYSIPFQRNFYAKLNKIVLRYHVNISLYAIKF